MPKITVDIDANASELKKQIAEAEIELKCLRKEMNRKFSLGEVDAAEKIQLEVNQAKTALKGLQSEMKNTSVATAGMSKSVGNGSNTLMQFSRIAQDAPFGIMGIGNNITATAEAFGHLSKSSGGAGNALKAVASSMIGTGGILLAVSLVTTALTIMSQQGLSIGDVVDKLSGNFNKLASDMREAGAEAAKSSATQISSMNAYVSVAKDVNLSMSDRLIAVDKLQKEYPAYFGNLTKEQILNGNVEGAVKEVTKALIAKAKATAYANKVADLAGEELNLMQKQTDEIKQMAKMLGITEKAFISLTNSGSKGFSELARKAEQLGVIDAFRLASTESSLKNVQQELKKNISAQEAYTKQINSLTGEQIKLDTPKPGKVKVAKTEKPLKAKVPIIPFKSEIQATDLVDIAGIEVFNGQVDKFGNKIKGLAGVMRTGLVEARIAVSEETIRMNELLANFNNNATAIIQGNIAETFGMLGTSIGEALATGGNVLNAIGQTILAGLSSFLSDMGSELIKYGTLAVVKGKLDIAIATGGPAAIAAGIAAIGVGIALKAVSGAIGAKAKGGSIASSNSGGNAYQSSGGNNSSFSSNNGSGTVVFEISGQSLIGVLSNTLDKNRRLGGSLSF